MSNQSKIPRQRATTPVQPRTDDKATFLLSRGWAVATGTEPWSWFDPKLPAARYTLEHAYDVMKGQK